MADISILKEQIGFLVDWQATQKLIFMVQYTIEMDHLLELIYLPYSQFYIPNAKNYYVWKLEENCFLVNPTFYSGHEVINSHPCMFISGNLCLLIPIITIF